MNPISQFESWYAEEKKLGHSRLPAACCLSTIGLDGFPNARFVSLKELSDDAFVITGPLDSRKGLELSHTPKAALTFWWTDKQIRIQGTVSIIPESKADDLFNQRNHDAKIVSATFEQGKEIQSITDLKNQFNQKKAALAEKPISRPKNWGGVYIHPIRIEFMAFKQSRLHERLLYTKSSDTWHLTFIQP